jgi:UDP-N-acetylmuramoylalanine--D-glutamate ligase
MREYFKDKANIFLYQQPEDYLIATESSFKAIQKYYGERAAEKVKGTMAMAKPKILLDDYKIQLVGEHNRQNVAAAVQLADLLRIDSSVSKRAVANFKPLDGRLQYVRKILSRSIYNDNNSTTPDATVAAIKSLQDELEKGENITLIMGGSDKGLDTTELERVVKRYVKNVILIPGTGTDQIRFKLYDDDKLNIDETDTAYEALQLALEEMSSPGDAILFSPAFASFDQFSNEYEREEAFLDAIEDLKR